MSKSTKEVLTQITEVVSRAVALRAVIAKLVAELQVCGLHNRFAVCQLSRVTVCLRRSEIPSVCLVCGVLSQCVHHLVEMHVVERQTLALLVTVVGVELQGDVTSVVAELTVDLQHTARSLRVGISDTPVPVMVHHHRVGGIEHLQSCIRQRIIGI